MIRRLRLASGLVLFAYVLTHFVNHSLGIVSLAAMEAMLSWVYPIWSHPLGASLLYGALLLHLALALYALWQRRSLKLQPPEVVQYALGFSVPLLAAQHVTTTRIDTAFYDGNFGHYINVLTALWYGDPVGGALQVALLLAAWTHACMGLRFWLRLRWWYDTAQPFLYAAALLVPVLALLGYVAGGREIAVVLAQNPDRIARMMAAQPPPEARPALLAIAWGIRFALLGSVTAVLLARWLRHRWQRRHGVARITYPGGRWIEVVHGFTVLEASRMLGVPHASVCGGKGRCSTCRVRVRGAPGVLPNPSAEETSVLRRIGAPPSVRLACQLRPRGDIEVVPLLPAAAKAREGFRRPSYAHGGEREIAILFADLRDFTRVAETKLPYDVVFMLNRYFQAMGQAIDAAGGHVDKFIGDGVMALFGLDCDPAEACRQSLLAARLMSARLKELNTALAPELEAPLRMGIGIHFGPTIVGEMGYGGTRSLTAVGDTVNTASRVESLCKIYDCELVISEELVRVAGADLESTPRREIEIRGRRAPLVVRTLKSANELRSTAPMRVAVE